MVEAATSRVLGYRWVGLGALWFAWLVNVMDRASVPSLLPFIRGELALDHSQVGLIGSIYLLGYAVAQFSAGILADRLGPKQTMHIAMVAIVLTFLTGLTGSFGQLLLLRIAVAVGEGHQWVPALRAQADWFPQKEKGRAAALLVTAGLGGLGLMPLLASLTVATTGSWRAVFFWLAGAAALALFILNRYFFSTPKDAVAAGRMGFAEFDYIREGLLRQTTGRKGLLRAVLRDRMLWVYSALSFCNMAVYNGSVVWLASFLYEQHNFNVAAMGVVTSLPYFVGILALLLGGWLVDKHGAVKIMIAVAFAAMIPILYLIATVPSVVESLIPLVVLLGFFSHLSWTPIYSYQIRRYPKEIVGTAAGISSGIGMLGGFFSPLLAGYLVVQSDGGYSFHYVFIFLMAFAAISAATALLLREDRFVPAPVAR